MRQISLLLGLLLCWPVSAGQDVPNLIHQRLALMQRVAAYKWHHELPIEDSAREKIVIQAAVTDGLKNSLTAPASRAFYRAQIEAAKDIQQCWFERWQGTQAPGEAPDLVNVIRPKLLKLGSLISAQLSEKEWDRDLFYQSITVDCLSEEAKKQIFHALNDLKQYDNRYQQIVESRILRVGTTGDYAPFSFSLDGQNFSGIDIDMARDLARSLGTRLEIIHTSWPELASHFKSGDYDIAMSGVSISDKRKKFAYFSLPYHVGGKTPVALCSRIGEFNSLEKIDRPGVRVIVNPGGTNEKFVDAELRHATKVLHQDNRNIFDEIIERSADLMITDAIEVRLQSAKQPQLCAAMPGQYLTDLEKAYMMPQDDQLREAVNGWLQRRIKDGTVAKIFAAHLDR